VGVGSWCGNVCVERGYQRVGELLASGVTVAMREEVVGGLGGLLSVDRILAIGVLQAPS
jgi:hypothetical protein